MILWDNLEEKAHLGTRLKRSEILRWSLKCWFQD